VGRPLAELSGGALACRRQKRPLRGQFTSVSRQEGHSVGETNKTQTVEKLFQAIAEGDVELFHAQFQKDSIIEFPQSGERIAGEARRRSVYRSFPGRPTVNRIVTGGDLAVAEATVDYDDTVDWRAVFIFEFHGTKIAKLVAYWAKPFEASKSRKASIERADG
jgi:ketosteroid isomerase-like protein